MVEVKQLVAGIRSSGVSVHGALGTSLGRERALLGVLVQDPLQHRSAWRFDGDLDQIQSAPCEIVARRHHELVRQMSGNMKQGAAVRVSGRRQFSG